MGIHASRTRPWVIDRLSFRTERRAGVTRGSMVSRSNARGVDKPGLIMLCEQHGAFDAPATDCFPL
jgi:hypothetical protein